MTEGLLIENQIIEAATLGGSVADMDFSIWSLFVRADAVVKAVIILLLLASVWCWAIIFDKVVNLRRLNSRSSEFEQSFWSGNSLDDLYKRISASPRDPMSAVFVSAMREWRRTSTRGTGVSDARVGVSDRIDRVMQITLDREMDRTEKNMTFLATTGSTARSPSWASTMGRASQTTARRSVGCTWPTPPRSTPKTAAPTIRSAWAARWLKWWSKIKKSPFSRAREKVRSDLVETLAQVMLKTERLPNNRRNGVLQIPACLVQSI